MKNMLVATTVIKTLPMKFKRLSKAQRKSLLKMTQIILIVAGILLLANNVIATLNTARNGLQGANATEIVVPDRYEQIVITIMPGDRAWTIQKRLTPNENINEILYYVNQLNGKSVAHIKPGEEIVFLGLSK